MSTYSLNLTLANIHAFTVVVLDIFVVWLLLYYVLRIVRNNTRTIQIFKGILLVVLVDFLAKLFGLRTLQFFADIFINWGFLAIIIIFQPEIRALLEHLGKSNVFSRITTLTGNEKENLVDQIVTAVMLLSKDQTGALISIEQSRSLEDFVSTGTRLNSDVTAELLTSIFVTSTPLHDGAVIIRGDKIACASAYFPPTNLELPSRYGARHRAAIGISEISDAVTICVSEETGSVSVTEGGKLVTVDREQLRNYMLRVICGEATEVHSKRPKEVIVSEKPAKKQEKTSKGVLSKLAIRTREEEPVKKKKKPSKVEVEEVIPAKKKVKAAEDANVHKAADEEAAASQIKLPHKKHRPQPSYPERKKKKEPAEVKKAPVEEVIPAAPVQAEPVPEQPAKPAQVFIQADDDLPEIVQERPAAPAEVLPAEPEEEMPDLTDTEPEEQKPAAPRTRYEEVRAAREAAYRIMYNQQAEQKEKQQAEITKKAARTGRYDTTKLDISKIVGYDNELDSTFNMVDSMGGDSASGRKGGNR